jgi:hybrid cluster-associated redox disulfide protein
MAEDNSKVTKDMLIGDVINNVPEAGQVIVKYFGSGCFTCPGMRMESIDMGAIMHGVDPDKVVEEINSLKNK